MSDLIHLLPDHLANQIAAGEVIQRPASAVKELMENAVDAGATSIQLIIQDAGKSLVQVIDNGRGMSSTDARMSIERHATSKISDIEDLFRIRTMGFRGEALASIAAVSQVVLKTRIASEELGTLIEVENSVVSRQEPCSSQMGTNISMKNLFFNVPARRNFLKSNAAEMRHIVDEFIHVALAFPGIFFSLTSNGEELFHLEKGTLKQRIVQVLGPHYNARLVGVDEKTDYLNISGFVGKPEAAKKTRGDQYFFVNQRFIRSAYLNHAVMHAYQDMLAPDSFPAYILFIDLDPSQVDINVHPTKQEIKFEDEKIVYAFVQSAVKHALAQYSITPTLDFDLDPSIQQLEAVRKPFTAEQQFRATGGDLYKTFTEKHQAHFLGKPGDLTAWKGGGFQREGSGSFIDQQFEVDKNDSNGTTESLIPREQPGGAINLGNIPTGKHFELISPPVQIRNCFIVLEQGQGFLLIHQQHAHERILFEKYIGALQGKSLPSQQSLFPASVEFSPADSLLLESIRQDLRLLGYLIEPFGRNSYVIQGTPIDIPRGNEKSILENLLDQVKHFNAEPRLTSRDKLIRSMAMQHAIKKGRSLGPEEMEHLVTELFECRQPNKTPDGRPTYIEMSGEYLDKLFS